MTEQMFVINMIICQEVFYDILMLNIKQLFPILTRICYDFLILKSLRRIMLKLAADEGKDEGKEANKGRKKMEQMKVTSEVGRSEVRKDIPYQVKYRHVYLDCSHLLFV